MPLGVQWVINDGFCLTYISNQTLTLVVGQLLMRDSEESMMGAYYEKEKNRKEKMKWISVLDNLPFFVLIYDKAKQRVTYMNQHFKSTFFGTIYS